MNILKLVLKEIAGRRLSFVLGLVCVTVAVGGLVGAVAMLRAHDLRTQEILSQKRAELEKAMDTLQDDYRKISLKLGFNLLIMPKGQNLSEFYEQDYGSKYMPEEYAERIAHSKMLTIQHLLPTLQQRVKWPEKERTILLAGVRGEVPMAQGDAKKPLMDAVPKGGVVLGAELHKSLGIKEGDIITIQGRQFKVAKCMPEKGNKDDVTAWISLPEAQEMLDKKGLINGILALECGCAWANVGAVRADLEKFLPDTQVIESASNALARAEARVRAADEAKAALVREEQNRAALKAQREKLASVFVPLAIAGAAIWIGFLALANVRERRPEIGILRALGLRSIQILMLFLGRALATGLAGGIIGFCAVWLGALWLAHFKGGGYSVLLPGHKVFDPILFAVAMGLATAVSALGGLLPALVAAQQDPAEILREE